MRTARGTEILLTAFLILSRACSSDSVNSGGGLFDVSRLLLSRIGLLPVWPRFTRFSEWLAKVSTNANFDRLQITGALFLADDSNLSKKHQDPPRRVLSDSCSIWLRLSVPMHRHRQRPGSLQAV